MNARVLRPANVTAAIVLLSGMLTVIVPHHIVSIAQVAIVSIAVSAAIHALAAHVPSSGWISPFKWLSPFSRSAHEARIGGGEDDLYLLRRRMGGRRQRVEGGPPMPPAMLRLLRSLIVTTLDLDIRDEKRVAAARARVSPITFTILTTQPLHRPKWYRTVRADKQEVAAVVQTVLDDLDRLTLGAPQHQ